MMMLTLVLVVLLGAPVTVEVVAGGQFYHRAGHLVVDEPHTVPLDDALASGLIPCPECEPPRENEAPAKPASAYYQQLLEDRASGTTRSVPGRARPLTADELATFVAAPAAKPSPSAPARERPAPPRPPEIPADGIPVPGTGGLLKVPTFKSSNGVVAVPLQFGGFRVIEPPSPTLYPVAQPAADPAPSGR